MSIWEKLAGATAELLRSGPIGAVLGGVQTFADVGLDTWIDVR